MITYWILLLLIAFIAYNFGSISTLSIAGLWVFHRDLHRIGKKRMFVSNFRRLFGYKGFLKLLGVELVRDFIPILLGGLLLRIKDYGVIGMAFAGFCLVLGRLFPVYNRFRGSTASICLICMMLCVNISIGLSALVATAAVAWFSRYLSLAALAGALVSALVTVLVVDDRLLMVLCLLTIMLVLVRNFPALKRIANHQEMRLSLEEDISYKFDEKFDQ